MTTTEYVPGRTAIELANSTFCFFTVLLTLWLSC